MSLKRDFYTALETLARDPAGAAVLERLIAQLEPVLDALHAGDDARARALVGDLAARCLLAQALPGWEFGTLDGGDPGPMDLSV